MRSTCHPGHPEVEVRFTAGGKSFLVHKRFSGATGTARLVEAGGGTWLNEQAEERLQQLTGAEVLGGGGKVDERLRRQWGHLWAWQGEAGGDPVAHANHQHEELVARLQSQGGAVVLQSPLDARVAEQFATFVRETFTTSGSARAGSELGRAEEVVRQAEAALAAAQAAAARLDAAMRDCEEAEQELTRIEAVLPGLQAEADKVEAASKLADRLRAKLQLREQLHQRRGEAYQTLATADAGVRDLRGRIVGAEGALGPKNAETQRLQEVLADRRRAVTAAQQKWNVSGRTATAKRAARDLARAFVAFFERQASHAAIEARHGRVAKLRGELQRLRGELAARPAITEQDLAALRNHEKNRSDAHIALEAMAAGVDVLAAGLEVMVGGERLAAGDSRVLTEATEITVGGAVRLRIRPGGGRSLDDARLRRDEASHGLADLLGRLGVGSSEIAAAAVAARAELAAAIGGIEISLEAGGAAMIDADLAGAELALAAAQADVERRLPAVPGFAAPVDCAAATALETALQAEVEGAETAESAARHGLDQANAGQQQAEQRLRDHLGAIEQEQAALTRMRAQLELLVHTHGDDHTRQAALARLLRRRQRAAALVAATQVKLAALQPDMLESDRRRLGQAIRTHQAALGDARQKRAGASALLESNGTSDPAADLATAQVAADRARERRHILRCRAEAVRRLDGLFGERLRAVAARFTQPLADRMTDYLQCLFGPEAQVRIEAADDGKSFRNILVSRPIDGGGAIEFDVLSGGAREQVAAAVRLAVAEILAADHDGSLPVVFDDAFAYSDQDRVAGVQRMLYHAASRGLQIIVLACNPNDYAGLGAVTVHLSPPALILTERIPRPPDPPAQADGDGPDHARSGAGRQDG
jgi:hypothetical protein